MTLGAERSFGGTARTRYRAGMVGLSVAIGRFIEALFWAILKVAGSIAGAILGGVLILAALWFIIRRVRRR